MRVSLVVLVVASALLLVGCGPEDDIKDVEYHKGPDGLVFSFMENSPPEKVYPEQTYPVTVRIQNKGAFSLLPYEETEDLFAQANLRYDPFYFSEDPVSERMAGEMRDKLFFEGKSAFWPTGETRIITLGYLKAKELHAQRVKADTTVGVSLCYPYETELSTEMCVDYDPHGDSGRTQPCRAEDATFDDQGAPVAVTKVEVESLPAGVERRTTEDGQQVAESRMKPVFRMTLRNVGGGQLVRARDPDEQELCFRGLDNDYPSRSAKVEARLGGKALECKPEVPVFHDGKAEVMCTLPEGRVLSGNNNYMSVLEVFAAYVYKVQSSVEVQIDDSLSSYEHTVSEFTCSDFDGDYERCAAFSEGDCAYCEDNERCLPSDECERCPDALDYDASSDRCVSPCPGKPSVNLELAENRQGATVTCNPPSGIDPNDYERCGCAAIQYKFASDRGGCEPLNARYEENSEEGERSGNRMMLEVDVPSGVLRELRQNETRFLCARGVRDDGVSGAHEALRLLKPPE